MSQMHAVHTDGGFHSGDKLRFGVVELQFEVP